MSVVVAKYNTVDLADFVASTTSNGNDQRRRLINIRGCNGSGKSTIPQQMIANDSNTFEVTWYPTSRMNIAATVVPGFATIVMGKYHTKCGGLDTMKSTTMVGTLLSALWDCDYDIIMEGIIASSVYQSYVDLFNSCIRSHSIQREVIIYNIVTPLDVCLSRIAQRNGGKPIKDKYVMSKRNTVVNNSGKFVRDGFRSISVSNECVPIGSTLDWFYSNIGT